MQGTIIAVSQVLIAVISTTSFRTWHYRYAPVHTRLRCISECAPEVGVGLLRTI